MNVTRRSFLHAVPTGLLAVGSYRLLLQQAMAAGPDDSVLEAHQRFATSLYAQLAAENIGRNLFFSPLSVSMALTLTLEGARGHAALQIGQVLGYADSLRRASAGRGDQPWRTPAIHSQMGQLTRGITATNPAYQLSLANALWLEKTFPFRQEFRDTFRDAYHADAQGADFVHQAEAERVRINAWVQEQTQGRIRDFIAAGSISAVTRLVLANAIHFKGSWLTQFDPRRTRPSSFTLSDGQASSANMMSLDATEFHYAEVDGPVKFQLLRMPYGGDKLSMVFLLPRRHHDLPVLESKLSHRQIEDWLSKLAKRDVIVSIPRFTMESKFDLATSLQSLGMTGVFEPGGLAGLSDSREANLLFISQVLHKACVEVNEQGADASAATGVVAELAGPPSTDPLFIANRPFLFMIRDDRTGTILFLGRMMDPQA